MVARAIAWANQPGTYTKGLPEEHLKKLQDSAKATQAKVKKDLESFNKAIDDAVANPKKPEECKNNQELFIHLWATAIKNKFQLPNLVPGNKSFAPRNAPAVSEDARNLYRFASKYGGEYTVIRVYNELGSFQAAINLFPQMRYYLVNPATPFPERLKKFLAIISGRNLHPLTENMLLKLFVDNKFIADPFSKIALEVKELYAYHSKFVEVEIITAHDVQPHVLSVLIATIERATNPDEKYEYKHKVDKNIVGGFIIKIGDYVADYSMKHDIQFYRGWLEGALATVDKKQQATA